MSNQPPRAPDYTIIFVKDGKICSHVVKAAMDNDPLLKFIDDNNIPQSEAVYLMGDRHLFPMSALWRDSDDNYDPDAPMPEIREAPPMRQHNANERVTNARDIGLF